MKLKRGLIPLLAPTGLKVSTWRFFHARAARSSGQAGRLPYFGGTQRRVFSSSSSFSFSSSRWRFRQQTPLHLAFAPPAPFARPEKKKGGRCFIVRPVKING